MTFPFPLISNWNLSFLELSFIFHNIPLPQAVIRSTGPESLNLGYFMVDVKEEQGLGNTTPKPLEGKEWVTCQYDLPLHSESKLFIFSSTFTIIKPHAKKFHLDGAPNFINILFALNFRSKTFAFGLNYISDCIEH